MGKNKKRKQNGEGNKNRDGAFSAPPLTRYTLREKGFCTLKERDIKKQRLSIRKQ